MTQQNIVRPRLLYQVKREDLKRIQRNLEVLLMDLQLRQQNVNSTIPIMKEILIKEMENSLSWSRLPVLLRRDSQGYRVSLK